MAGWLPSVDWLILRESVVEEVCDCTLVDGTEGEEVCVVEEVAPSDIDLGGMEEASVEEVALDTDLDMVDIVGCNSDDDDVDLADSPD